MPLDGRLLAARLLAVAVVVVLLMAITRVDATTHVASFSNSHHESHVLDEPAAECGVALPTDDDAFAHGESSSPPPPPLLSSFDSQSSPLAVLAVRPADARGHANHGWLNSYHTFSFASYHDPTFDHFHSLRVLNEDRVVGGAGFGMHPHANFEIFSYVVSGALRHDDSLGHREVLPRGSVQFTSAGSGLSHSEYNDSPSEMVHFLQVWVMPEVRNTPPQYATKHFTDEEKMNQLRLILSRTGINDSIAMHQDMNVYACLLEPGVDLTFDLAFGRDAFVHVIEDATGFASEANRVAIEVNGVTLRGGDGVFVRHDRSASKSVVEDSANRNAISRLILRGASSDQRPTEFLLFDIRQTDPWR